MQFWIKSWSKKVILLLGGELSFGVPRDRRGYSPLYYWGTTFPDRLPTVFRPVSKGVFKWNPEPKKRSFLSRRGIEPRSPAWQAGILITILSRITWLEFFVDRLSPNAVWIKSWSKKDHSSPRRGIEPRSPAWQAGILTTILPRNCVTVSFAGDFSASFQRCFQMKSWTKKSVFMSSACTWTPVSRVTGWDTHHYTTEELHVSISLSTVFHQMWFWTKSWSKKGSFFSWAGNLSFVSPAWQTGILATILPRNCVRISFAYHFSPSFQRYFQIKCWTKKSVFLSSAGNWTGLSRDGRGYWSLYYRGITCLEFFEDRLSPNAVLNKILK